jgi:hypothetical protein
MRENRPYGSEGGDGEKPFPTPIQSGEAYGQTMRDDLSFADGGADLFHDRDE